MDPKKRLPIQLRLPDGTFVEFVKRGDSWHATDRGNASSGSPRYMPEQWLHAALDEIVRLCGQSADWRQQLIDEQTKRP